MSGGQLPMNQNGAGRRVRRAVNRRDQKIHNSIPLTPGNRLECKGDKHRPSGVGDVAVNKATNIVATCLCFIAISRAGISRVPYNALIRYPQMSKDTRQVT